jgi:5-methylcytosine-specific restriction endonuclease McrA
MKILLSLLIVLTLLPFESYASCRSQSVKKKFDRLNDYPYGRKGYVVDHICALSCGGKDILSNLQYQTINEGKLKDRWETTKTGCAVTCNKDNSTPKRMVFNCK